MKPSDSLPLPDIHEIDEVNEAKINKAKELNNSALFDVHRWSDYPEVNNPVNAILEEIKELRRSKGKRIREEKKVWRSLKVIILDLWAANKLALNPYRSISKNKSDYNKKKETRYRKIHLTYDYLIPLINDLDKLDYLTQDIGYRKRSNGKKSKLTRIKATDKLINKILFPEYGVDRVVASKGQISIASHHNDNEETIILKDNKKNRIDYVETEATKLMRHNLQLINNKIAKERIALEISDEQFKALEKQIGSEDKPREIDFTKIKLHRLFNNSSFEEGGRFYGGWWQNIPREYRKYITISYKDSIELDYSGHHFRILYAKENLNPPDDPYDIDGFEREDLKIALQIILNASSKEAAKDAICKEKISDVANSDVAKLVKALEIRHQAINKYYYTGEGIKLQYLDSMLAEQVMLKMLKRGATVLPLHDSFLVLQSYREELEEIMKDEFEKMFYKSARITLKQTAIEVEFKEKERQEELSGIKKYFLTDDFEELLRVNTHKRYREIWGS